MYESGHLHYTSRVSREFPVLERDESALFRLFGLLQGL